MKIIPLTLGEFAKVSDEDFDFLNKYKWHCSKRRNTKYAERRLPVSEGGKLIKMHRLILGLTNPKEFCDHRDRDGLNNQRDNLRKATAQENLRNKIGKVGYSSKYKGVFRHKADYIRNGKKYEYTYWVASITINSKEIRLKTFKYNDEGEVLAAKMYDENAIKYFGDFANLNFK